MSCEGSAFQRGMALLLISLTADSDDQLKSKYRQSPIEKQTVLRIRKRLMPSGGVGRREIVFALSKPGKTRLYLCGIKQRIQWKQNGKKRA